MKNLFFLSLGILIGGWISWPGIILPKNWECFFDIIERSRNEKVSLKAILAVYPKLLFKEKSTYRGSKFRIVSDACFR
tara:strand:- start:523 stop:756 length:234 start_codon:yes stop_codon:yes gene_type:complete